MEVFTSFFKKKRGLWFFFEKKNQNAFVPDAACVQAIDYRLIAL